MEENSKPRPNYYWSIFAMTCPRCRRGPLFVSKNAYSKITMSNILDMPETCHECGQRFHLEPGFWYGTGYVSYALTVLFSALTFILWWLIVGFSLDDYRTSLEQLSIYLGTLADGLGCFPLATGP